MSVTYSFLLVGKADAAWSSFLEEALSELGPLSIVTAQDAAQAVIKDCFDIVIIDAGEVDDSEQVQLISELRAKDPETHIVVATLSPTWRRARRIMRAGASFYFFKSADTEELWTMIEEVLERPPPRWLYKADDQGLNSKRERG